MAVQTVFFGDLMREWWEADLLSGDIEYAEESWRRLEREALPFLGDKEAKKVTTHAIRKIVQRIEQAGKPAVARKVKSHISQTFQYGINEGRLSKNPARDIVLKPYRHKPRRAITERRMMGRLMRDIEYVKNVKRRLSLKLLALTMVRPGELCQWEWDEIEWNECTWRIPPTKMKMNRPHLVPLPSQAMDALRDLHQITGKYRWVFPSRWDKSQHEDRDVYNAWIKKLGYGGYMTGHGFRAMGASHLSEKGWASEPIELQLAHQDKDAVRAAYQRSDRVTERRRMMQELADDYDMLCARAILGR